MEEKVMTSDRLKEVAHNAACIHNDVYQWAFFEKEMQPAADASKKDRTEFWAGLILVAVTIVVICLIAVS